MPRLQQLEKGNWIKKKENGKTSKLNKRKKTKSWNFKD